jgi:benzoate/toluate 1,2-dioxygenase beta subunit
MTTTETTGAKLITQNMIEQFLYREARYLDDREFEKWLECYADDVVYWMPSWDDNDQLVEDPQRDISLIYYANKGGLEDRVFRIRTERSSATSLPEPRTSHNISNVEVIERRGDVVDIRFNWHTMYFRYKTVDPYYGTSFYTRRHPVHQLPRRPDRRRRVLPAAHQHSAGLPRRRVRHL